MIFCCGKGQEPLSLYLWKHLRNKIKYCEWKARGNENFIELIIFRQKLCSNLSQLQKIFLKDVWGCQIDNKVDSVVAWNTTHDYF